MTEQASPNSATAQFRFATAIARSGGTPLAVAESDRLLGVIHLRDVVKPGIKERFAAQRAMGIANDYVEKPFGIGELLARIRVALRQGPVDLPPAQQRFGNIGRYLANCETNLVLR